jgi:hypothetical protein
MNSENNILSVDDIQTMSMTDIVNAYSNGYRLDITAHKLDMSTWLGENTCLGTDPNQTCIKNQYIVAGAGGIIALVLLLR